METNGERTEGAGPSTVGAENEGTREGHASSFMEMQAALMNSPVSQESKRRIIELPVSRDALHVPGAPSSSSSPPHLAPGLEGMASPQKQVEEERHAQQGQVNDFSRMTPSDLGQHTTMQTDILKSTTQENPKGEAREATPSMDTGDDVGKNDISKSLNNVWLQSSSRSRRARMRSSSRTWIGLNH